MLSQYSDNKHGVIWWTIVTAAVISRPLRRILLGAWIFGFIMTVIAYTVNPIYRALGPSENLAATLHMIVGTWFIWVAFVFFFFPMWTTAQFLAILSWFTKRDWNRFFRTKPID